MAWNAARPSGSLAWSQGDDDIRGNFAHVEEALARLFTFPGTSGPGGTSGTALPGSARAFYQTSAPTIISATAALVSGGLWVGDTDRALRVFTGSVWALLAGATYASAAPSGPSAGSLWVDSDDGLQYVYTGSVWAPARAKPYQQPVLDFDVSTTSVGLTNAGFSTVPGLSCSVAIGASGTWHIIAITQVNGKNSVVGYGGALYRISQNDGTTTTTHSAVIQSYENSQLSTTVMLHAVASATNGATYTYTVEGTSLDANPITVNSPGCSSQLLVLAIPKGD